MPGNDGPFAVDALPANRSGALSEDQARRWQQGVLERRSGVRRGALVPLAIGVILLVANGPASKAAMRSAVGIGCLGLAGIIFAAAGRGSLSDDVREGRVESIEGAIARHSRQSTGGTRWSTYFLDIAGRHLRTSRLAYNATPEAGIVRAFYFPRSLRVVNLELLPDRPLPSGSGAVGEVLDQLKDAALSRDPNAFAEARATAAALSHIVEGDEPAADPANEFLRLTQDALCGAWVNPLATVTFTPGGVATVAAYGGVRRTGRWEIDAGGRLLTDATGKLEPLDAKLTATHLTIHLEGRRVTFTRA